MSDANKIDADTAREWMSEYVDGALEGERMEQFRAAVDANDALRQELEELERTVNAVRAMPQINPPAGFLRGVRERLADTPPRGKVIRFFSHPFARVAMAAAMLGVIVRYGIEFGAPKDDPYQESSHRAAQVDEVARAEGQAPAEEPGHALGKDMDLDVIARQSRKEPAALPDATDSRIEQDLARNRWADSTVLKAEAQDKKSSKPVSLRPQKAKNRPDGPAASDRESSGAVWSDEFSGAASPAPVSESVTVPAHGKAAAGDATVFAARELSRLGGRDGAEATLAEEPAVRVAEMEMQEKAADDVVAAAERNAVEMGLRQELSPARENVYLVSVAADKRDAFEALIEKYGRLGKRDSSSESRVNGYFAKTATIEIQETGVDELEKSLRELGDVVLARVEETGQKSARRARFSVVQDIDDRAVIRLIVRIVPAPIR